VSSTDQSNREPREALTFSATMRPEKPTLPKAVDFRRLSRPVQERFAAATRGTAPPTPLLYWRARRTGAWRSLGASALLALAAMLLLKAGYGDVRSPFAIHGPRMLAADTLLVSAVVYGVVHAAAILRALGGPPYRAGTYLFPACIVEARGPVLRVWPVDDVQTVERLTAPTPALAFRMCEGSRLVVPARSIEDAARAEAALASVQPTLMHALADDDAQVLLELDPLHDGALSNPLGPTESMKRVAPSWIRFDWAVASCLGVVLGIAIGAARNAASDEAMFRSVAAAPSITAYDRYLSHDGRYAGDVRARLLPLAELRSAEATGSIEAVRAFAQAHASSPIQPEIQAAVRRAWLAQLHEAEALGTVRALDDLRKSSPDGPLDAEVEAARHAIYARAFAAWKAKAQPDAATAAFIERLLAWAEQSDAPTVEVRFQLEPSKTLGAADRQVTTSAHFPGPDALPSRYLTADAMKAQEDRVARDWIRALGREFSPDVLSARQGAPLHAGASAPTTAPTLVVRYAPEWAFTTTASSRPDSVFAGLRFDFRVAFVVPGGARLAFESEICRAPEPWRIALDAGQSRASFEQRVYDASIDAAFEALEEKLTSVLL